MIKLLKTLLLLATSLDPYNLSARESDKVIAVLKLKKLGIVINTTHTSYYRAWPNSKRLSLSPDQVHRRERVWLNLRSLPPHTKLRHFE